MTIDRTSARPWSISALAFYGALLGFAVGIVHTYVHAFWSPSQSDDLIPHIITRMVLFVGTGAAVLAAVSAVRNWLVRRR
jgi:hypothetical protein